MTDGDKEENQQLLSLEENRKIGKQARERNSKSLIGIAPAELEKVGVNSLISLNKCFQHFCKKLN